MGYKFVTAAEAAKAVRSGDWVDYGFGAGFPELMDKAIAARKEELKDVKIRGGLVIRPHIEVVECDSEQSAFHYYSWHIGDYERKLQSRGLVEFIPTILRFLPDLYRHHIRVDVACVPVSKPDENGSCGYFEINGKDDLMEGDEISGNLDSFGCEVIVKTATNERYTACIEDCGISFEDAVKRVFNKK